MSESNNLFTSLFRSTPTSRRMPDPEPYPDDGTRANYVSKNNETGAMFVCSAPTGSKHAKAMRQLCADVQDIDLPAQSVSYTRRALPTATASSHTYAIQDRRYDDDEVERSGSVIRTVSAGAGRKKNLHPPKLRHKSRDMGQDAVIVEPRRRDAMTFRRAEDDRKVSYHSKSQYGEVYVAAPKGSDEAEAYEEMARSKMAEQPENRIKTVAARARGVWVRTSAE